MPNGRTALFGAASGRVATLLLRHGARVNARNVSRLTPLHTASCYEVAELLIQAGADVNARNSAQSTPLHHVVCPRIAALLLRHGATVDAFNTYGHVPLHVAASQARWQVVWTLLEHGEVLRTGASQRSQARPARRGGLEPPGHGRA